MKTICTIFLLVFGLNGFSQDTLANVVIHTWAGGVCCSNGTDVTISLSDKVLALDFDSLVYVSSSGDNVLLYATDFHTVNTPVKRICTLTYGWSSMRYGNNEYRGTTSYYGLPESRFRFSGPQVPKLLVYSNTQVIKEGKVGEQFTMTAYP